jgi:hypothetical protein
MSFSVTPVTYYPLNFDDLFVNTVHLLLTENIKTGNQGITIYCSFEQSELGHKNI